MPDIKYFQLSNFTFQNGTTLPFVSLAYRDINPSAKKTALVITCFRGRLHNTCDFASGALRNYRIIVVALFGNGESSSPSNCPNFPAAIDYQDCVRAQKQLLVERLQITVLDAVVGFSMGGQTTYYWAIMYPDMIKMAVIICSSAKTSGHNRQFLEGPKSALDSSSDYVHIASRTLETPPCTRGLRAFGKAYSAWLTSADWFDQQTYKTLGFDSQDAWDLVATGSNYNGWDADDLLTMLETWQRGDVTTLGSMSLEEALSSIKVPVLLMPSMSDQYFRWEASERESRWLPNATFKPIPTIWGHLGGAGVCTEDTKWMDAEISTFLAS